MSAVEAPRIKNKVPFFRSSLYNALIVGATAFIAPGLYNAMTSTGAGGAQSPYLVLRATSVLSCMMIVSCYCGSIVANKVGLKWTLVLGTTGYALYSASLYANIESTIPLSNTPPPLSTSPVFFWLFRPLERLLSYLHMDSRRPFRYGTEWFVLFGAAACGITAGLFWASEGAIMVQFPEAHLRGRYLSLWLAFRNGGSLLGGSINLAFNASGTKTGKLDWRSYIVFVALQCIGPAIGALLTTPDKVQRTDGTKVHIAKPLSTKEELKALLKLSYDRRILLTIPLCFYAIFQASWVGSFLTQYFSVRARALASLSAALVQIFGNLIFGYFLDYQKLHLNTRVRWGFIGMMALHLGAWIWAAVVQHDYSSRAVKPAFDWHTPGFARGWVLYLIIQLTFSTVYNYLFWVIGGLAQNSNEVVRFTSIIRSWESAGGAVASGIASTKTPLIAQVGINFGLCVAVLPFSWFAFRNLGLDKHGNHVSFFDRYAPAEEGDSDSTAAGSGANSITEKDLEATGEGHVVAKA